MLRKILGIDRKPEITSNEKRIEKTYDLQRYAEMPRISNLNPNLKS